MHSKGEERREFQRLRLDLPIPATFASVPVTLLEIGVLGARIQHAEPLAEQRGELQFTCADLSVAMRCEVVRTLDGVTGGFASGMRFVAAIGESGDHLRALLSKLAVHALENRHDASATRLSIRAVDGDKTVRGADAQFVSYRFEQSGWYRRHVFLPEQPAVGFTVARGEDPEEMQRLCAVYEASDAEGRRLIRLFAELSVSEALQIPPRS